METAGEPASDSVGAVCTNSSQVLGGWVIPAASNDLVLYQTSDLFAAFTYAPYCLPLYAPRSTQPLEKFFFSCSWTALSSGLTQPFSANWCSTPTWGRNATSGGLPPSIFVPRNVEGLLPVGTKVTEAPVRFSNSSSTFWKLSSSGPVKTAATSSFWPSSLGSFTVASLPPS